MRIVLHNFNFLATQYNIEHKLSLFFDAAGCDRSRVHFLFSGDLGGVSLSHVAAREGRPEVLEFLRQEGADLTAKESLDGLTPLSLAVIWGHLEAAQMLVRELNRNSNCTEVIKEEEEKEDDYYYLEESDYDTLGNRSVVTAYIPARSRTIFARRCSNEAMDSADSFLRMTPLHWACLNGDFHMAKVLVQEGGARVGKR